MAETTKWSAPVEAVLAFLDGDGCDDEAFATLRRRLTLATPSILDSAAGMAYTVQKLDEAERRGAVKALHHLGRICGHGVDYADVHGNEDLAEAVARVHVTVTRLADRYESGEVTL